MKISITMSEHIHSNLIVRYLHFILHRTCIHRINTLVIIDNGVIH